MSSDASSTQPPSTQPPFTQPPFTMYTTTWCGYCRRLKGQLAREGVEYAEVDIEATPEAADIVTAVNDGNRTVPTPGLDVLRSDIGPPVGDIMTRYGVPGARLTDAVTAYRQRYHSHGIHAAGVYPGMREALAALAGRVRLATATAKRIDTAERFLAAHDLDGWFEVIGGSSDGIHDKAAILADTLTRLGSPDPARVIMVGDRHSDIVGAAACRVRSVAVTWGYGSATELEQAVPDFLVSTPAALVDLVLHTPAS